MAVEKITPILNVSDIEASFQWFEALGWRRSFSWNDAGLIGEGPDCPAENEHGPAGFAGVCMEQVTLFMCCGAQGPRATPNPQHPGDDAADGVWMSWWVSSKSEVDQLHQTAEASGFEITHPPTDEPWGAREFHLRHPDGHTFRISCGLDA